MLGVWPIVDVRGFKQCPFAAAWIGGNNDLGPRIYTPSSFRNYSFFLIDLILFTLLRTKEPVSQPEGKQKAPAPRSEK